VLVYTGVGLVLLLSLMPVIHGCTLAHLAVDRLLLGSEQVRHLQGRVDALTASRAAVVEAEAQAFQRLERDLHDGPQQRLVRLGMDLSLVERRLADDPVAARALLAEARTQTADALAELRALSRGIAPPILIDRGLTAALAAVAARCTVQVDLQVGLREGSRLPASIERAAYFTVSEALANVAKHSRASRVQVRVLRDRTRLRIEVEDDGMGGAHPAKGHGLAGLVDRLTAVDGTLVVESPPGGPTRLVADIPCALS
jgi:signal transduction histidine kinase